MPRPPRGRGSSARTPRERRAPARPERAADISPEPEAEAPAEPAADLRREPAADVRREPFTNTARVLLGMIAEGHATGYSIKAEIERSTRLFWGASVGGIYPELRRLRDAGLVSVRDDPRGGAIRHRYELTDAGREALDRWLTDPGEPVLEMRNEALLRLRFAGVLERAQQVAVIARMRVMHEQRAAELQKRIDRGGFDDPLHRMTVEFGLGWHRWAIEWCMSAERALTG